ncbi:MAG: hypothetical protein IJ497_01410 [Clostridia bacterium]|nr:hypothetical protein [Clostridia bacterium]
MLSDFKLQPLLGETRLVCLQEAIDSLKFPLTFARMNMTSVPDEIRERQTMFRDLLGDEKFTAAFTDAHEKLVVLCETAKNIGDVRISSNEELLYSLIELTTFTDAADALDEAYAAAEKIKSGRLLTFFRTIRNLTEDMQYINLKNWLNGLTHGLRSIRSVTLGVNLDAQLNVSEVGIVSINDQPYVSDKILDRALRDETPPDEYKCIASLGIHESGGAFKKSTIVVNRELYSTLNGLYRDALKNLRKYVTAEVQGAIRELLSAEDEIDFLLTSVKYLRTLKDAGLPLTFPEITDETTLLGLYNPLLTGKCRAAQIVPSNVSFSERERIWILTGPNSGGKTVYLGAVGHAQLMFQLGLPVCARSAKMKPYEKILTHFVMTTQKQSESRLVNETVRMKESLEQVTENTLLLLDETFSSTSAYDAMFLAEALIKYLSRMGCSTVYVTHLHELAGRIRAMDENSGVGMLTAKVADGKRTYEIVPHDGEENTSSMARDIVINSGLGFLFEE